MTVSVGVFGAAGCCDEAPLYAASAATAEATATNAGIAAHCLRLVFNAIRRIGSRKTATL